MHVVQVFHKNLNMLGLKFNLCDITHYNNSYIAFDSALGYTLNIHEENAYVFHNKAVIDKAIMDIKEIYFCENINKIVIKEHINFETLEAT